MIIKKIYFLIINQLVLTKKKYLKNKFNIPNYNKINGDDIDKSDEREHQKNKLSYKGIPIVEKYKYVGIILNNNLLPLKHLKIIKIK